MAIFVLHFYENLFDNSCMKKYKCLFIIFLILAIAMNIFVIVESCLPGAESKMQSDWLSVLIANIFNLSVTDDFVYYTRKFIGHFSFFLIDGVITSLSIKFTLQFKNKYKHKWLIIYSLPFGLFLAFLTELIQNATPGRYFTIADVGIDFAGYLIGFLIIFIIKLIMDHHHNKKAAIC